MPLLAGCKPSFREQPDRLLRLLALADVGLVVPAVEQFAHATLEHADKAYVLCGGRKDLRGRRQDLVGRPCQARHGIRR